MAKEWGYASHNGESEAAAVRASGSAQRTGPGDAHEAYQCGTLRPGLRLLGPPARSRHSLFERPGRRPRTTLSWPRRQARSAAPTAPGSAQLCAGAAGWPAGRERGRALRTAGGLAFAPGGAGKAGDESVSKGAFEAAFWSQWRGHLCAGPKRQAVHCPASQAFSRSPQSEGGFGRRHQINRSPRPDLLGPDHWHELYPIAKGDNQSPIELHTKDINHDPSLPPWSVSYDPGSCKTILNNGKTCRVVFDDTFDRSSKYGPWVEHMDVSKSLLTKGDM